MLQFLDFVFIASTKQISIYVLQYIVMQEIIIVVFSIFPKTSSSKVASHRNVMGFFLFFLARFFVLRD